MKTKSFKVVFISVILFLMFAFSNLAQASDLISCGQSNDSADRCTLCHLFVGIRDIIDWGKNILVVAAIVAIVAGAIMYIVSAGDNKMMESAKGIIKQAIWGVVIVLGAWVIINTTLFLITSKLYDTGGAAGSEIFMDISNWSTFSCDLTRYSQGNVDLIPVVYPTAGVCPAGTHLSISGNLCMPDEVASVPNTATEQGVRDDLLESGITINRPDACTDADHVGCTDVAGLQPTTISGIKDFQANCGESCLVMITGGSEGYGIHSETGTYNHINGYKVDVRPTAEIDNYITNSGSFTKIPEPRSDGAIGYRDSSGNTYYREGDHWDITYLNGVSG